MITITKPNLDNISNIHHQRKTPSADSRKVPLNVMTIHQTMLDQHSTHYARAHDTQIISKQCLK